MRPGRKVLLCDTPLDGAVSFGNNRDVYGIASLRRCNVCVQRCFRVVVVAVGYQCGELLIGNSCRQNIIFL